MDVCQESACGMDGTNLDPTTLETHNRWSVEDNGAHICQIYNGRAMAKSDAGVCEQHWKDGTIQYNSSYQVLLNNITGIDIIPTQNRNGRYEVRAMTSAEATIDVNGTERFGLVQNKLRRHLIYGDNSIYQSRFVSHKIVTLSKVVESLSLLMVRFLTNALYDYEGYNDGDYGRRTNRFLQTITASGH